MHDDLADSVDEWLELFERHKADALSLLNAGRYANAYFLAGRAIECQIKAAWMRANGKNQFPDRKDKPEIYVHNIRTLLGLINVDFAALESSPVGPKVRTVLYWNNFSGYSVHKQAAKYAQDMCEAAFGEGGVAEWMMSTYRLP